MTPSVRDMKYDAFDVRILERLQRDAGQPVAQPIRRRPHQARVKRRADRQQHGTARAARLAGLHRAGDRQVVVRR